MTENNDFMKNPDVEEFDIGHEEIDTNIDWSAFDGYEFKEGEIFTDEYPPQLADWCNERQKPNEVHYIEEIDPDEEGKRRFKYTINHISEEEIARQEAERVARLSLTAADVERAVYKAKGLDFDDIITMVQAQPLSEEGTPVIDIKALKIELKANNFYRGNPYVDQIGALLGFSKKQLDEFFETNDYTKLMEV